MTSGHGSGSGEPLDIGDRVIAAADLGGFLRPRIRHGTPGVIIGCTPDGLLTVHFATGRIQHASPGDLILAATPPPA
ncbi:hypothetical protein [Rhodococcus sp. JS3073]|uniref:hypothetical protein n=1 Tax=Rhodococcus sp. JS3073 TaxID=3002901 RepID=UPI00228542BA|nr:hypothetical protein [Rhodococcus sp. JS3073]WAM19454.1 hypothetical protein OYT95_44145 [Rhodococcus sp. JS3073]